MRLQAIASLLHVAGLVLNLLGAILLLRTGTPGQGRARFGWWCLILGFLLQLPAALGQWQEAHSWYNDFPPKPA